jgi:hypothetical protein
MMLVSACVWTLMSVSDGSFDSRPEDMSDRPMVVVVSAAANQCHCVTSVAYSPTNGMVHQCPGQPANFGIQISWESDSPLKEDGQCEIDGQGVCVTIPGASCSADFAGHPLVATLHFCLAAGPVQSSDPTHNSGQWRNMASGATFTPPPMISKCVATGDSSASFTISFRDGNVPSTWGPEDFTVTMTCARCNSFDPTSDG